jgi:sugar O-acyltransferase (sialic acid O-acetyltransferase NeuD family)
MYMVDSVDIGQKALLIYGASGFGREIAWLVEYCIKAGAEYKTVGFIDDDPEKIGAIQNNIPIMSITEAKHLYPNAFVVSGIGDPIIRTHLMDKAADAGFNFISLIHPKTQLSNWVEIGDGTVVCEGSIFTTNIKLGKFVQINLNCTIGHDVIMGDYTTLAPGVHVSGWVHLGKRVYVGTGVNLINGTEVNPITIGNDAVIGAGACVIKSIPDGETWAGVPAKRI